MDELKTYTVHFHDDLESKVVAHVPSFDLIQATSDEEARERAIALLRDHPTRQAVEVWEADRPVM